jgi:Lon-like protease
MRRLLSPVRLAAAAVVAAAALVGVLFLWPSQAYIFLPDRARALEPLVTVKGERDDGNDGGIYFVDVVVRRASLFERLFPNLRDGATLVPAAEVNPPGTDDRARRHASLREMARSQKIAAAVALQALGYKVVARPTGVLVASVLPNAPAVGKLKPSEVVEAVDGKRVRTPVDLRRLIRARRVGEKVRLTVRSGREVREVELETILDPHTGNPVIGVFVEQDAQIRLPVNVKIDTGEVGGPSAGLAFALDLIEELGRDVDRGYRVAATGTLELDGTVVPIGGVKQKTIGAERSRIEVLVVPAGENAREARRYARRLRVVPVKSFRQALRALATLPEKRQIG